MNAEKPSGHLPTGRRKEIISGQIDAGDFCCSHDLGDVALRDNSASPTISLRFHPSVYAGPMDTDDGCDLSGTTKRLNDMSCRFHVDLVANRATIRNPFSSDMSNRKDLRKTLQYGMARKKTFSNPAATAMNQWVREAFIHADDKCGGLSYDQVADAMTAAQIGGVYDKTKVQKMTVSRKVSLAEAQVISKLSGYPLPQAAQQALSIEERLDRLSDERKKRFLDTLADLEAAQAAGA